MRVALIPKILKTRLNFTSLKKEEKSGEKYKNPINPKMEYLTATLATISAGFGFALYVIGDMADDVDFSNISKKAGKKFLPNAHPLIRVAVALLAAIGTLSALYCAVKLPKNLYKTKVETYKKQKEMDVYVRTNNTEKKLTERIDENAKNANSDEKQQLATDYIKLKSAKNNIPYFIDSRTISQIEKMKSK